ncbi:chloride channel protein [Pedobacter heparinus]|uniref:chloride channel protein n=1 Tax=Pedobacter heparinus TaxID=984 RepID=UPI00292F0289|nr:chloride channel protein [Pedobacter heparinus]
MVKKTTLPSLIVYLLKWITLILIVGIAAGTLSAVFLAALNLVTLFRDHHTWLLYLLPVAGLIIGLVYHHKGKEVERGNNLVFDTVHNPKDVIPFKMVPLVLTGTVVTHLFGGSAGREGTALQMAAATADQLHIPFKLSAADRTILLIAGLSAGFASVFGTPLAGVIFGMEVLLLSKIPVRAIAPAIAAAFIAAYVTELWGVGHTHYPISQFLPLTFRGMIYSAMAGVAFGFAAVIFVKLTEGCSHLFKKISYAPLRPFAGGIVLLLLFLVPGAYKFTGLGIPTILESFGTASQAQDFALKILFTAITLGSGFKGGEVTPLFFVGATLGSALSIFLPLPVGLLAGMGFVAVFAGAAKTPLACCVMAMELFGLSCGIYVALACMASYFISGRHSIYNAPENKAPKHLLFGKIRNFFF